MNLTNSSNMENIKRDYIILLSSKESINLSVIRLLFTICCNYYNDAISNTHYYYSICNNANFNIYADFVEKRTLYNTPTHWLIKQFLDNEKVTNSTTKIITLKNIKSESKISLANKNINIEFKKEIPNAFTFENKAIIKV